MEYIREMLLRQRTALGRLMLGGGSAEEPETAAASPATERTSPAAPAPWETDGTASGTGGWEIRGNSFAGAGADRQTGPTSAGETLRLVLARKPGRQGGGRSLPRKVPAAEGSFPELLVGAVQGALGAILGICAFVELFYVLGLPLRRLPAPWGAGLAGAVELFSASAGLPGGRLGFVLAAGLAGFGGLSVLCQTAAVLAGTDIKSARHTAGRLLHGAISALCMWVLANLF